VYHSILADKLVDINNSEKSLEWAETGTDSDSDRVNSSLLCVVVDLQLNACVFYCTFFMFFLSTLKTCFYVFSIILS